MKKVFILLFMLSFFSKVTAGNNGTAYDYEFNSIDGDLIKRLAKQSKRYKKYFSKLCLTAGQAIVIVSITRF